VREKFSRTLKFLFHNGPMSPQASKIISKFGKEQPTQPSEQDDIYICHSDPNIQIPEALLKIKGYPIEAIKEDVEIRMKNIQEWLQKCEKEEQMKKEQEAQEKSQAEQRKQQEIQEKRKKVEQELLMRKLEDKRKQQEEASKRNNEMRIRLLEEDEKRKARISEMLRKRSEGRGGQQDKKQKEEGGINPSLRTSVPFMKTSTDFMGALGQIQENPAELIHTQEDSALDFKIKIFDQNGTERPMETLTINPGDENNLLIKSSSIVQLPVLKVKAERESLTEMDHQRLMLSRTIRTDMPNGKAFATVVQKPVFRAFKVGNKTAANSEVSSIDNRLNNMKKDMESAQNTSFPVSRSSNQRHHSAVQSGYSMKATYYEGRSRLKHFTTNSVNH